MLKYNTVSTTSKQVWVVTVKQGHTREISQERDRGLAGNRMHIYSILIKGLKTHRCVLTKEFKRGNRVSF